MSSCPRDLVNSYASDLQAALWRPVELLNGRLALLGVTAGLLHEATSGSTLAEQVLRHPLSVPSAFALVVLLTAVHRQVQPRMKTRGLLMSPRAHRWLGRVAMVAFVAMVVREAADPGHRPALQQLQEWAVGTGAGNVAELAARAGRQGGQPTEGFLNWWWVWW
jgi:hypothetical protein